MVLYQHPLAHGQGLGCGGCYHVTLAWVDEHLHTGEQPELKRRAAYWNGDAPRATVDAAMQKWLAGAE